MKHKESVHIFEEAQQVIYNLKTQLKEARKIEENIEYQKKRTNDINQLEEEFGKEEKGLEE